MKLPSQKLLSAIPAFRGLRVMVVGDLMLDRYIWGSVDRISPEAPVPVVKVIRDEERLGGAANAARNLSNMGAQVAIYGLVGEDKEGDRLMALLRKEGMDVSGIVRDSSRETCVKTRVIAHVQQMLRIDREQDEQPSSAVQQRLARRVKQDLEKFSAILVSDYGKGCICKPLMDVLGEGMRRRTFSLKRRPLVVDPHPLNYQIYHGMTVAKPNRKEAEEASGIKIHDLKSAQKAGRLLIERWGAEMMLISLGEDGLLMLQANSKRPVLLETVAQEVHDVSGAGDTVTALFAGGLGAGLSPTLAGQLANIGAGIVVSEVGTVAVNPAKLRQKIRRLARQAG